MWLQAREGALSTTRMGYPQSWLGTPSSSVPRVKSSGVEIGTAIDVDDLPRDVAPAGAEQQTRQRREVSRPGGTAEDRPVERVRRDLVRLAGPRQHSRDERIHGYLVRGELHGEPAGEAR